MLKQHVTPQDNAVDNGTMFDLPGSKNAREGEGDRTVVWHDPVHLVRVGKWLKGLRERKGLSQTNLAQLCQVTSAHISQIEKGRRFPADALCLHLAQHLGCHPMELRWRVQAEKSPALVRLLSSQGRATPTSSSDPRIAALAQTLQDLRQTIPEERYERLLDTIFGVLSPYEDFREAVPRQQRTTTTSAPPDKEGGKRATMEAPA